MPRVKTGLKAKAATDGEPVQTWNGTVTHISPRMEEKQFFQNHPAEYFDVKTREIWIDLETDETLIIGMRVDVSIEPAEGPNSKHEIPNHKQIQNSQMVKFETERASH